MIVKALVRSFSDHSVVGYVLKDVSISVSAALKSPMRPIERIDLELDTLSRPQTLKQQPLAFRPLNFRHMPAEHIGLKGFIVASSTAAGLEYVVANWAGNGDDPVDIAVAAARELRKNGGCFMGSMERFAPAPLARHGNLQTGEADTDRLVWSHEAFDGYFAEVGASLPDTWLPTLNSWNTHSGVGAMIERKVSVNGRRMTRLDVLSFEGEINTRHLRVSSEGGWQIGSYRRIDSDILRPFETGGRMVTFGEGDMTAWHNWKVRLLVKVPPYCPSTIGGQSRHLAELPMARITDGRLPIAHCRNIEVIDDPREALSILCRVSRGYLLSELDGDVMPKSIRRLSGKWLAVCVPATWDVAVWDVVA